MSFDKLEFVKRLERRETFSRPQVEALSDAFDHAIREGWRPKLMSFDQLAFVKHLERTDIFTHHQAKVLAEAVAQAIREA